MTRINLTRTNEVRTNEVRSNEARSIAAVRNSLAWGPKISGSKIWGSMTSDRFATKNAGALLFAAVLIVCSVTVGCSSDNDKPKQVSQTQQIPAPPILAPSAPVLMANTQPAPKKVVHKKPATANYTDQASGVTFEYPRRYAIETGNAATQLIEENPIAMNFVQPGGIALAAVELPETIYANTDFSSAFFDVSVNKTLTAEQCIEFAVPQAKVVSTKSEAVNAEPMKSESVNAEAAKSDSMPVTPSDSSTTSATAASTVSVPVTDRSTQRESSNPLTLADIKLHGAEAVSGEGTRQSDAKYFHVFQNGSCYEFALNVTTVASEGGMTKHVDRDKVFTRLDQILSTVKIEPVKVEVVKVEAVKVDPVKISPVATPAVTAEAPVPTPTETPAQ